MKIHNYSSDYAYQLSKSLKENKVKETESKPKEDVVDTLSPGGEGEMGSVAETEDRAGEAEEQIESGTDPSQEKTEGKKKKNKKASD